MAKKKKIIIEIDDREPKSIIAYNDLLDLGIAFERKRMKVGDYVHGNICIERKQIDDFCASILDNRIKEQVKNMKENFAHNFIIIVGSIKDRTSEINENCLLGKITSLVIKEKMTILQCDNDFQFLYLVKSIIDKVLYIHNQERMREEAKLMLGGLE